jgi:hypothetical protein
MVATNSDSRDGVVFRRATDKAAGDAAGGEEDAEHRIQVYPTNFEPLAPFPRQAASR